MTRSSYKPVTTSQKIGKIFLHIIRIVVAIVFIFSGFVKLVDPLGFTYIYDRFLSQDLIVDKYLTPVSSEKGIK